VQHIDGLELRGLMIYPSLLSGKAAVQETIDRFTNANLPLEIISGGTGEEADSKELSCTEHRSGSYVYEAQTRIQGPEDLSPNAVHSASSP
jgi:D-serine deaminase-like pyridoxal phosphate-dependent protein